MAEPGTGAPRSAARLERRSTSHESSIEVNRPVGCRIFRLVRTLIAAVPLLLWAAFLAALAIGAGFARQGDAFNIVHWELTRLTMFALERTVGIAADNTASNGEVGRYFELLRRARAEQAQLAADQSGVDPAAVRRAYAADLGAVARLRPAVESRFEDAVTGAIRRAGLVERLPVFADVSLVWPPVSAGFSVPPHILIISPRDRIALEDTQLLRGNLSENKAAQLERNAERAGKSVLVDQIAGLGSYPSIVDENDTPLAMLQTLAHEWMHEYLIFHPLGARYGQSNDMTLINETVANLVGRELGSSAYESLHLPPPAQQAATAPAHRLDFNQTLHQLRLEVDALLRIGRIDEAERRMDETQRALSADGYQLRRINQAYFAFYGSYGDSAAASSPLGGEVQTLRRLSPSLASFVHRIENVATPSDVGKLLRTQR